MFAKFDARKMKCVCFIRHVVKKMESYFKDKEAPRNERKRAKTYFSLKNETLAGRNIPAANTCTV